MKSLVIESIQLLGDSNTQFPISLMSISAGFASLIDDYTEKRLTLDELIVRNKAASYLIRVSGTSMINAGILDKSVLLVDRSIKPYNGDIVVAVVDNDFFVKRLQISSKGILLIPENPEYPLTQLVEDRGDYLWGVVLTSINIYK